MNIISLGKDLNNLVTNFLSHRDLTKFRQVGMRIIDVLSQDVSDLEKVKEMQEEFNKWTYSTLCKLMGTPPTEFVWRYTDAKDKINTTPKLTPQQFYKERVQDKFSVDDYICVINDPRKEHPYYKRYTVQYLGNITGGKPTEYLNLPIDELKNLTYKSIKNNDAVWFGCDVGKSRYDHSMDTLLINAGLALNADLNMTKEERLKSGESLMSHAMVFSGLNEVSDDGNQQVDRWQVENSWGTKGSNKGFYDMSTEWFDEFVYEVVVHKKYLNEEMEATLKSDEITVLPLWDPMGALA